MATESKKANGEIISNTEDKKVKSKKKTPAKEADDENVEVEATIKVTKPKKTISTAIDIQRRFLPDGKVEETKTTTTTTTINGKVEDTKVQKESRVLSDEEAKLVIQEGSDEEEEEEEEEEIKGSSKKVAVQENGTSKKVVTETKSETKKTTVRTTEKSEETKKPAEVKEDVKEVKQTVTKQTPPSEDEEEEEEEAAETEQEEVVVAKPKQPEPIKQEIKQVKKEESEEEEDEEEEEEVVEEKHVQEKVIEEIKTATKTEQVNGTQESEEEDEEEEEEEEIVTKKIETKTEPEPEPEESESEPEESEPEPVKKAETKEVVEESEEEEEEEKVEESKPQPTEQPKEQEAEKAPEKEEVQVKTETSETETETITSSSVPEVRTTTKKETTEITSSVSDDSSTHPISTQTELHRVENVTVTNRTTKTLDNSYEQLTQHGVPTVRTYFAPPNRERISTSPQPAKPYTPTFTPERKQPERRHSLLLDRLSTERQVAPPESYQNTYNYQSNQSYETVTSNQWGQEPQSEVVIASNVKPSSISNSQWYQPPQPQPQPNSNVIYNTVQPTTPTPSAQPSWQKPSYDSAPYSAPAYQPEPQSYAPQPSTWGSNNLTNLDSLPSVNAQSNQYSFMSNKSTTESYSQKTTGSQQFSTGYVPPPWESDPNTPYQSTPSPYYQPHSTTPATTPTAQPSWTPTPLPPKFTKPSPLSYQPPKPNQSFVKKATPGPISEPGRKTYYSEYERRYISVPESTYIPTETKAQPQWDPSPQYYYDNPEPTEEIEQPWRKELREFTEKSTKVEETTVIQPPWTEEVKYPKNTAFSPQPTWSQTIRPRSWRERSYDESAQLQSSQEWPRASTLNRRPVSAFVKTRLDSPSFERARGVSVDRYNVNSYQAPASYAPASNNGYTLPWEIQEQPSQAPQQYNEGVKQSAPQQSSYHNPQVPAYHVRPTESRDYQVSYQPRWSGMGRECPVQSRSFKYLQMLTGTEDGVDQPEPFVVQQPHHSQPRPRRV